MTFFHQVGIAFQNEYDESEYDESEFDEYVQVPSCL